MFKEAPTPVNDTGSSTSRVMVMPAPTAPDQVARDLNSFQREIDRQAAYEARIEAKAAELRADYRADADVLWESLGNVTARFEAAKQPGLIKVLRAGGSPDELAAAMRYLRELVMAECDDTAAIRAEGAVQKEDQDGRADLAEALFERRWGFVA